MTSRSSTGSRNRHRRRHRARRSQPQRRLRRRPRRARLRHRPRAVRNGPGPPAASAPAGRPARHPRAPDPGRPRRPHRPRRRPLRADAPARRRAGRTATTSSCRSPAATGSSCRSSRSTGSPATRAGSDRRCQARRDRVAAREAARPQGRRRPGGGAARAVRVARRRRRPRVRPGHAVAVRDGGVVPVRGDARPAARRGRGQGRHGAGPADGPARVSATSATARPRSRCAPRSRRSRTASRSRSSCPTTVLAAQHHATFSQRFAAFPLEVRLLSRFVSPAEQKATLAGLARRHRRHRHRHASAAQQGRPLPRPRPRRGRRGAALRRGRQGTPQAAPREVDVLTLSATPIPRTLNLALAGVRDLSVIETPPEDRLPIQTQGRRGLGRARPRRDPARARPRRPGLLRPQPGRDDRGAGRAAARRCCPASGSWSVTARWPRARSRR